MPTWLIVAVTSALTYLLAALVRHFTAREKKIEHKIERLYPVVDAQFALSMAGLLPPALFGGTRVTSLINGQQIFSRMLDAIRAAKRTITFETFIYWSGEIGREFAEALIERAKAGVRVHVLLDWLGSNRIDADAIGAMADAGVEVYRYHPLRWYNLHRFNNRTHRKLLIVDGRIGFIGGIGIADQWSGNAEDSEHWRDSHFMVEGPTVAQLQSAFMDNWLKTRQCVLHGADYFPKLAAAGACRAQVFMSSPGDGSESMRLMYLLSITSAAASIKLASAYFVPDDMSVVALAEAGYYNSLPGYESFGPGRADRGDCARTLVMSLHRPESGFREGGIRKFFAGLA